MKKGFKSIFLVIFAVLLLMTGCNKNDDPNANFKNPKKIEYKTKKGTIQLTYDDDGTYEVTKNDPYVTLRNRDSKFRIDMDYEDSTVEQQEKTIENFGKDTENYTIIKNVNFNGYKGNVMISKKYATANVYLYLDENSDIISNIKVSAIMTSDVTDALDKGKKAEDILYNQEKVQQILKTVKYIK